MIETRDMLAATYEHVATEVPPDQPQIEYFAAGDQWTPRGDVLRCIVAGDGLDDEVFVYIDDKELTLREFGKLLSTYAGWGMRIIFVPDEELEKDPKIEIREPEE
jgi:nucleoside-diphosphate-sugar epimerase